MDSAEQLMQLLEDEETEMGSAQQPLGTSTQGGVIPAAAGSNSLTAAGSEGEQEDEEEETMEAPEQLLQLLSVSAGLDGVGGAGAAQHCSSTAESERAARRRARDQATTSFGALLKAAANTAACGPRLWGLLCRLYTLQGQLLPAQEAALKQVRALQGTPYRSDGDAFVEMADASLRLGRAYLASSAAAAAAAETVAAGPAGGSGSRELAAARLHLRGVIVACEERFCDTAAHAELRALLSEVLAAQSVCAPRAEAASSP
jgi:hypothetical protein